MDYAWSKFFFNVTLHSSAIDTTLSDPSKIILGFWGAGDRNSPWSRINALKEKTGECYVQSYLYSLQVIKLSYMIKWSIVWSMYIYKNSPGFRDVLATRNIWQEYVQKVVCSYVQLLCYIRNARKHFKEAKKIFFRI